MIAYVDTSVALRLVLGEADPLGQWLDIEMAMSSELLVVEALRTIDRARLRLGLDDDAVAAHRADMLELVSAFHLAPIDRSVLQRAGDPFPTLIRTLDAIHLATALRLRTNWPDLVFASHDRRLCTAADAVGFETIGGPAASPGPT